MVETVLQEVVISLKITRNKTLKFITGFAAVAALSLLTINLIPPLPAEAG